MSMKEKLHTGELYLPGDRELFREQQLCLERVVVSFLQKEKPSGARLLLHLIKRGLK